MILDEIQRRDIIEAISRVRQEIIWKPGKAESHLLKRIRLGHLPNDTTLAEYNKIATLVVNNPNASVYIYFYGEVMYPTILGNFDHKIWLVMISLNGVLETVFPPDDPEGYLTQSKFMYWGLVKELKV